MVLESLHTSLSSGGWVVGEIFDRLKATLVNRLGTGSVNANISELCLSYYRKQPVSKIILKSVSNGLLDIEISILAANLIEEILRSENDKAGLARRFSSAEGKKISDALELVSNSNPDTAALIEKMQSVFVKIENVHFRSASHPHAMGCIFFGSKIEEFNSQQVAVSIVHELAHQELFLMNLVDRLISMGFDYNEIHAPFQGKKRPPIGRLHSLWALYRMVQFERDSGLAFEKHQELLRQNIDAFEKDELTDFSRFLVRVSMEQAS